MSALVLSHDDDDEVSNHPRFYFDDTLVVIRVEKVRFKVHKYQLLKSETFADMFAIAEQGKAEGKPVEGTSDENPLKLEGVSASDFESLLTALYAGTFPFFPRHFPTNPSQSELSLIIPAFRLANMWNFAELRAYLMPLAERALTDVDKIAFAREFGIDDWVTPAYTRLCQRNEPLDSEEAAKIGMEGVILISRIREERYSVPAAGLCSYNENMVFRMTCTGRLCGCSQGVSPVGDVDAGEKIAAWVKNGRVFCNSS